MNNIYEIELPGIGKKFQIMTRSGDKLVIIIHDDGRRELYHFDNDNPEENISMITLDDSEARRIAAIIGGMTYLPRSMESVNVMMDEMVIEWYRVEPGTRCIGKTIGELQIRKTTGASIIAVIQKDHSNLINPGPDYLLKEGSTLVVVGNKQQMAACKKLMLQGS